MTERRILSRVDAETAVALGELYTGLGEEMLIRARHLMADAAEADRRARRRRLVEKIGEAFGAAARACLSPRQAIAATQRQFPEFKLDELKALWQLSAWRRRFAFPPAPRPPQPDPVVPAGMPRLAEHPAFRKARAAAERARRDLEIIRLARRGLTNIEIGARVRLHKETVSRIITKQLGGAARRVSKRPSSEDKSMRPNVARSLLCAVAIGISGIVAACSPAPPPPRTVENERIYPLPRAEVWQRAVDWVSASQLTIKSIDKDSGLIYADATYSDFDAIDAFADCGSTGFYHEWGAALQLNLFVTEAAGGAKLRANAKIRQELMSRFNPAVKSSVDCVSTGVLERQLLDAVE